MTAELTTLAAAPWRRAEDALTPWVQLAARLLLAAIFLISGYSKLTHVAATQTHMEALHVPAILVWPIAAWELATGVLLVLGFKLRPLAWLLAFWCLLTAAIFYSIFADPMQEISFLKNLTMARGFLLTSKLGVTAFSIDARLAAR